MDGERAEAGVRQTVIFAILHIHLFIFLRYLFIFNRIYVAYCSSVTSQLACFATNVYLSAVSCNHSQQLLGTRVAVTLRILHYKFILLSIQTRTIALFTRILSVFIMFITEFYARSLLPECTRDKLFLSSHFKP